MRISMANRLGFNGTDDLPLIPITGLYEDLESGIRAKVLINCVQAGVDLCARFKPDLWRFDWLAEEPLRNMAFSTAKNSALVIISTSRASFLPPPVADWIATWNQEPGSCPSALVVLLPKPRNLRLRRHLLCERLQYAAQQKGAKFFCEYFEPLGVPAAIHREQKPAQREISVYAAPSAAQTHFTVPIGQVVNRVKSLPRHARRL